MNIDKLEAELIKLIKESEERDEPLAGSSWQDEQGVLLSREEALAAVMVIGQLKSLEASVKGIVTLKDLFTIASGNYRFYMGPLNGGVVMSVEKLTAVNQPYAFTSGHMTKESMKGSEQLLSQFVMELVQRVRL